jgi:flagellar basal body L-ring protein FlgH
LLNPYLPFLHPLLTSLLSFLHSPVHEQAKQKFDKHKAVKVTRTLQPDLPENSLIRTSKHNNNCRKQNPSQQDQKEKKEKPKEKKKRIAQTTLAHPEKEKKTSGSLSSSRTPKLSFVVSVSVSVIERKRVASRA